MELLIDANELRRNWVCRVARTGYHNGAECTPNEPHGNDWRCSWQRELALTETTYARLVREAERRELERAADAGGLRPALDLLRALRPGTTEPYALRWVDGQPVAELARSDVDDDNLTVRVWRVSGDAIEPDAWLVRAAIPREVDDAPDAADPTVIAFVLTLSDLDDVERFVRAWLNSVDAYLGTAC